MRFRNQGAFKLGLRCPFQINFIREWVIQVEEIGSPIQEKGNLYVGCPSNAKGGEGRFAQQNHTHFLIEEVPHTSSRSLEDCNVSHTFSCRLFACLKRRVSRKMLTVSSIGLNRPGPTTKHFIGRKKWSSRNYKSDWNSADTGIRAEFWSAWVVNDHDNRGKTVQFHAAHSP